MRIISTVLVIIVPICWGRSVSNSTIIRKGGENLKSASSNRHYDDHNSGHHQKNSNNGRNDNDNESENSYNYDDTGGGVYAKLDEIIYPFQQYIQVRNSYSVEHLPFKDDSSDDNNHDKSATDFAPVKNSSSRKKRKPKKKSNLDTSASTNRGHDDHHHTNEGEEEESGHNNRRDVHGESEDNNSNDDHYSHGSVGREHGSHDHGSSYTDHKPRLTEEVENYKKQEVYEEKGYADGAYDHGAYGEHSDDKYKGRGRDDDRGQYAQEQSPSTSSTEESRQSKSYHKSRPIRKRRLHLSEHPTSTKLLEYAATKLYDKDAHEKGIYAARDNIHCPEVIDFDLSSKKMAMGKGGENPRGSKPRLTGLGSKIKCLKEKYWGKEPLPRQIFMEPSESRMSVIKMPTFDQFYKSFRDEVDSISSFQHV